MNRPLARARATAVLVSAAVLGFCPAAAANAGPHIERQDWSFSGFSGQFDAAQLQRGFQVYSQVCVSCHGLKRVSFRNLAQEGGPEFPLDAVKALAAAWANKPLVLDAQGKMVERLPTPADPILGPYRNEKEARASQNNGALPPDLSVIAKARSAETEAAFYELPFMLVRDIASGYQEGGADYLFALLMGYGTVPQYMRLPEGRLLPLASGTSDAAAVPCVDVIDHPNGTPDACVTPVENMYYNAVFPGHQIAMAPPLAKDNFVTYQDGSGSLEQNARDVTAFLAWAADPHLNARKQTGWQVMLYLLITTALLYFAKQRIWKRAHP